MTHFPAKEASFASQTAMPEIKMKHTNILQDSQYDIHEACSIAHPQYRRFVETYGENSYRSKELLSSFASSRRVGLSCSVVRNRFAVGWCFDFTA